MGFACYPTVQMPEPILVWKPPSEPPDIPDGTTVPVIVAVRGRGTDGKLQSRGAVYCNNYTVDEELGVVDDEDDGVWTGFVDSFKHDYYYEWFEQIDNVVLWHPMIYPPEG